MIRTHPDLQGIYIPNTQGKHAPGAADELRVRCLADDIAIYLKSVEDMKKLQNITSKFTRISNHRINYGKSFALLVGGEKWRGAHIGTGSEHDPGGHADITWVTEHTFTDKYHGVHVGGEAEVKQQWGDIQNKATREAEAARARTLTSGIAAKEAHLRASVISKIMYPMKYQSPSAREADEIINAIQRATSAALLGGMKYWPDRAQG